RLELLRRDPYLTSDLLDGRRLRPGLSVSIRTAEGGNRPAMALTEQKQMLGDADQRFVRDEGPVYECANPYLRVRGKSRAVDRGIEVLAGSDQPQVPLLDQVVEGELVAAISPDDADHQAQVRHDQLLSRSPVAPLDAF